MTLAEKSKEFFKNDLFAVEATGITIDEVSEDGAVCSFEVQPYHKNANNVVMGGALYTIADFTFAVAANADGIPTVTLNATINYLAPARGDKITATAKRIRVGRTVATWEVTVNDGNKDVAHAVFAGYRMAK